MANYDWREYRSRPWRDRFPFDTPGWEQWVQLAALDRPPTLLIEQRQRRTVRPRDPCLFVSHRQADVTPALRIAYLACQVGFDYWIDVLDPFLSAFPTVGPSGPTPQQSAAAIAAIIEMALLNSTHVVAVMTPNTKGSQWVPYEYGRVKEPAPVTLQAACWVSGSLTASTLPEYLYLGIITRTESELQSWLRSERRNYGGAGRPCGWTAPVPPPL